jgi:N-ethylmaleimide reductase
MKSGQTVADYARAARNEVEAGFGGVQILANYLYLLAQFLNRTTNTQPAPLRPPST